MYPGKHPNKEEPVLSYPSQSLGVRTLWINVSTSTGNLTLQGGIVYYNLPNKLDKRGLYNRASSEETVVLGVTVHTVLPHFDCIISWQCRKSLMLQMQKNHERWFIIFTTLQSQSETNETFFPWNVVKTHILKDFLPLPVWCIFKTLLPSAVCWSKTNHSQISLFLDVGVLPAQWPGFRREAPWDWLLTRLRQRLWFSILLELHFAQEQYLDIIRDNPFLTQA